MSTTDRDNDRYAARTETRRPGGGRRGCRLPPQKPHAERGRAAVATHRDDVANRSREPNRDHRIVPNLDTLLAEFAEPWNLPSTAALQPSLSRRPPEPPETRPGL